MKPGFYQDGDATGQIAADVLMSGTPPLQMLSTMGAGSIDGYASREPGNQAAVIKAIGLPMIADTEIWNNNPEKVFGITADFADENPNTVLALTKALIRAGMWLDSDNNANRAKAIEILSRKEYGGAENEVLANSMTGTFEFEKGDKCAAPDLNVFFRYNATSPYY